MKKTWADLKHGDRLRVEDEEWAIIDILPNSMILLQQDAPDAFRNVKVFTINYMVTRGWQIVQPDEEEVKVVDAKLEAKCPRCGIEMTITNLIQNIQ